MMIRRGLLYGGSGGSDGGEVLYDGVPCDGIEEIVINSTPLAVGDALVFEFTTSEQIKSTDAYSYIRIYMGTSSSNTELVFTCRLNKFVVNIKTTGYSLGYGGTIASGTKITIILKRIRSVISNNYEMTLKVDSKDDVIYTISVGHTELYAIYGLYRYIGNAKVTRY